MNCGSQKSSGMLQIPLWAYTGSVKQTHWATRPGGENCKCPHWDTSIMFWLASMILWGILSHIPPELKYWYNGWDKRASPLLDAETCVRDIHIFCNASESAYGSVAYLRTQDTESQVEVSFSAARSRVAPKRQLSIPRLELCAALTGAQLAVVNFLSKLGRLLKRPGIFWHSDLTLVWLTAGSGSHKRRIAFPLL